MKLLSSIIFSMIFLVLSGSSIAALECPTVTEIQKNAKFIVAKQWKKNNWNLYSASFKSHEADWNIFFWVQLDAQNPNDALRLGQKYFENKTFLREPQRVIKNGQTSCCYDNYNHFVAAFSPAKSHDKR